MKLLILLPKQQKKKSKMRINIVLKNKDYRTSEDRFERQILCTFSEVKETNLIFKKPCLGGFADPRPRDEHEAK